MDEGRVASLCRKKHPGTGKTRLYPPRAVIDALVLSALTAMGIPAVRIGGDAGPYASVLNYGLVGYEQFQEKEAAGQEIYLLIGAGGSIYTMPIPTTSTCASLKRTLQRPNSPPSLT